MVLKAQVSIDIDAPFEKVWGVMIDLPKYKEWNPFIIDVDDASLPLSVGDTFTLCVRWEDGGEVRSPERITRVQVPSEGEAALEYRYDHWMHSLGMIRATRVQTLHALDATRTRYESTETFRGWLARFTPLAKVQAGFDAHAAALKARAEGSSIP